MLLTVFSYLSTETLTGLPKPHNRRYAGCGVVAWQGLEQAELAMREKVE